MPQWPWKNPRPGVDEYGRSPLWHHAAEGDLAGLKSDLQAGLDVTAADKDGCTALHVAIQRGHVEVASLLLAAGADPNAADRHGNGPLWTACFEGGKDIATPGQQRLISLLLKAGADPNHMNKAGRTPECFRELDPKVDAAFREAEA